MSYKKFSQEEIERAGSIDLVALLSSQGETLKREGKSYAWLDNGQKVSIWGNRWYHQYERVGGNTIDFIRRYMNKTFVDAVDYLLDGKGGEIIYSKPKCQTKPKFILPKAEKYTTAIDNYLINSRGIYQEVLKVFKDNGLIYSVKNNKYRNVMFIGKDEQGAPRHAHLRGISGDFKCNIEGSDDRYSFHWNGEGDEIYLFESPIDMISFICMYGEEWEKNTYVSACGVSDMALFQCLKDNNKLSKVYLCLDNDIHGKKATERIAQKLNIQNIKHKVLTPIYKDWNEDLIVFENELEKGVDCDWNITMQ